jgi:hypothetical protein
MNDLRPIISRIKSSMQQGKSVQCEIFNEFDLHLYCGPIENVPAKLIECCKSQGIAFIGVAPKEEIHPVVMEMA